jgi:hypothetical protein
LTQSDIKNLNKAFQSPEDGLCLALQCRIRGLNALSDAILAKALTRYPGKSPRGALHTVAWDYLNDQLIEPGTDWMAIYKRLSALLAADEDLRTDKNRALVASLEAALVPSKARPGTIAAQIDGLIDARFISPINDYLKEEDSLDDPRVTGLIERGFDAVPDLIEHLDDRRLTRYREFFLTPGVPAPPHHCRVGDLAGTILERLSQRHVPRGSTKARARAWWAEAKSKGEEAYLVAHVCPRDPGDPGYVYDLVRVIARKYPRQLARMYRKILDGSLDLSSQEVAKTIRDSSLSPEEKGDLLALAAGNKDRDHWAAALKELRLVDERRFVELVAGRLDRVGKEPTEKELEEGHCLAWLVAQTAKPRAWLALERTARRGNLDLLMKIFEGVSQLEPEDAYRERLAFLATFLEDTRLKPGEWSGFRDLEVRNIAALQIAYLLGRWNEARHGWSRKQWAEFREKMRRVAFDGGDP